MDDSNVSLQINKALVEFEQWCDIHDAAEIDQFLQEHPHWKHLEDELRQIVQRENQVRKGSPRQPEAAPDDADLFDLAGTQIGPYRLAERLGQGGMGSVWLAEQQEPVRRKIAIKLIKPGFDSELFVRRFDAERQALALMSHPNIAGVLDAGATPQQRPYFVMEYVSGVSIIDYCDHHQLTLEQRLDLFLQLCEAVQHAHQKGIIHRDIKPSNVMVCQVDGKATVKVIDFGLAKACASDGEPGDRSVTRETLALGTPLWMSPEQARGRLGSGKPGIDTRTDIYSLGAVLYQLLTGTTPILQEVYLQLNQFDFLQLIQDDTPPSPSLRLKQLPEETLQQTAQQAGTAAPRLIAGLNGDLDWITSKAIEKERYRRYQTVAELAEDVRRYLNHEPVLAGPPSNLYRFKKFLRRHRLAAAFSLGVAGSLIAGAVVSSYLAIWALNERTIAQTASSQATEKANDALKAQQDAETARDQAEKLATRNQRVVDVFVDSFLSPDPNNPGVDIDFRPVDVLKQALVKIDEMDFSDDPLTEITFRDALGQALHSLGEYELAVASLETSLELNRIHRGKDHEETIRSLVRLGNAVRELKRGKEVIDLLTEAHRLARANLGDHHAVTLEAMSSLATALDMAGQRKDAIDLFEKALAQQKTVLGEEHKDTLSTMSNMAVTLQSMGKRSEAKRLFEETLRIKKAKYGQEHTETLASMVSLAETFRTMRRLQDAMPLLKKASQIQKAKLGDDHPLTLLTQGNLATTLVNMGQPQEAILLFEEILPKFRDRFGASHRDTLMASNAFAGALAAVERWKEAASTLEDVYEVSKTTLGPRHSDTLLIMNNWAAALDESGQREAALSLHEKVLKIQEETLGHDHPATLTSMHNLASSYAHAKRYDEAISMGKATVEGSVAKLGQEHPKTILSIYNLATFYRMANRLDEATPVYEQAVQLRKQHLGAQHPKTLAAIQWLAWVYRETGRTDRFIESIKELHEVHKQKLGASDPQTLAYLSHLGSSYLTAKQPEKAAPVFEEAFRLGREAFGDGHSFTVTAANNLVTANFSLGRRKEALELLEFVVTQNKPLAEKGDRTALTVVFNTASVYQKAERYERAVQLFKEALKLQANHLGKNHADTIKTRQQLAKTYLLIEQYEPAVPLMQQLLEYHKERRAADHPITIGAQGTLQGAMVAAGRYAEAEPIIRQWLEALKNSKQPHQEIIAWATVALADALAGQSKYAEAKELAKQVLSMDKAPAYERARATSVLGICLASEKKFEEAETHLLQAFEQLHSSESKLHFLRWHGPHACGRVIQLYQLWDKPEQAQQWRDKLKEITQRKPQKPDAEQPDTDQAPQTTEQK